MSQSISSLRIVPVSRRRPQSYTWAASLRRMEDVLEHRALRKAFLSGVGLRVRQALQREPGLTDLEAQARDFHSLIRAYHRGACPELSRQALVQAGAALLFLLQPTDWRDFLFGRDNPYRVFRYVREQVELDLRICRQLEEAA